MPDETQDKQKQEKEAQKGQTKEDAGGNKEAPKKEEGAGTPQAEAKAVSDKKPAEGGLKKAEKPKPAKVEKVRPTNCVVCNKAFKHKIWYYRDGKYFCTKRCWEKFTKEKKKEEAKKKEETEKKEQEAKAAKESSGGNAAEAASQ